MPCSNVFLPCYHTYLAMCVDLTTHAVKECAGADEADVDQHAHFKACEILIEYWVIIMLPSHG